MQELLLYDIWHEYARNGQSLFWKGNSLKIIEGGELNTHFGPDIKHARFEYNGIVYQGSVEFHVQIEDWYKHHHHYDPLYQDVLLHVIGRESKHTANVKHNISDFEIPTFLMPVPIQGGKSFICLPKTKINIQKVKQQLQIMALKRMEQKVLLFNRELKTFTPEKIFYHKFMRALGYPENKYNFEQLALKIPPELYEMEKNNPLILTALYFGCAGFLDMKLIDPFYLSLKRIFSIIRCRLSFSSLKQIQWQFSAVRPSNHPHYRLAAWVAFVTSIKNGSPFGQVYSLLEKREEPLKLLRNLLELLVQKPVGYWHDHWALQKVHRSIKNREFISRQRAKEIIINLIIPLNIALAKANNNIGFVNYLESFYMFIPGNLYYSSMVRKRPQFTNVQKYWKSFTIGQSLIYMDKHHCQKRLCNKCPIEHYPKI